MTDERTLEAVRYLGYGRHAVDDAVMALIGSSFAELDRGAAPRSVYRIFDLSFLPEEPARREAPRIRIGNIKIESRSLSRNLLGCRRAVVFGATLGAAVDGLMRRYSLTDMSRAVVLQACAAACLEEYCDRCQDQIAAELAGEGYLCPRFSPGYGDFDIRHQGELLRMLDAAKRIGLSMTDSCMLTPTKSVTAVIGVSDTRQDCHRKGCEACDKQDCLYRRDGGR